MEPELAELLGNLRGREAPSEDTLRRLREINPQYRITWTPPRIDVIVGQEVVPGREALWWLNEVRPGNKHDYLRRDAGHARLARFEKLSPARKLKKAGVREMAEDWIAGYHLVGWWPEHAEAMKDRNGVVYQIIHAFGSDKFFEEIILGERACALEKAKLDRDVQLDDTSDEATLSELDENPTFRADTSDKYREAAKEDWAYLFAGKHSVHFERTLKGQTDGSDGQQVA